MNNRKLTTGFYRPTESFRFIPEHIAVCFEDDLTLVAVLGSSHDDTDHVLESHQYAQLFAAAPETLQKLSHALAHIAQLEADARLADAAWTDNQSALKAQAAEIAALKAQLNTCKHARVTIHSKLATAATHDMPAEYWQKAECDDCGVWMAIEDIPEDAEVSDEN
jgi:septal ring factor EnvC (AmiA/AmiB activator)